MCDINHIFMVGIALLSHWYYSVSHCILYYNIDAIKRALWLATIYELELDIPIDFCSRQFHRSFSSFLLCQRWEIYRFQLKNIIKIVQVILVWSFIYFLDLEIFQTSFCQLFSHMEHGAVLTRFSLSSEKNNANSEVKIIKKKVLITKWATEKLWWKCCKL